MPNSFRPASGFRNSSLNHNRTKQRRARRVLFESLENRSLLATLTEIGTTLQIELDNTNEFFGISSNGTSYTLTSSHSFVDGGVTSGRVESVLGWPANPSAPVTVTAAGLAAYDSIQIVDAAGIQGTRVTIAGGLFSDNVAVSLNDDLNGGAGEQSVVFSGSSSFGAASLSVFSTRNIVASAGSAVSTSTGGITLQANTAGTATGSFLGISLQNAVFTSSGSGNISLEANGVFQSGIRLVNSDIVSTATGNIALVGRGGGTGGNGVDLSGGSEVVGGQAGAIVIVDGTGAGSGTGVIIDAAPITGANTRISSSGADVEVVGQGGTTAGKGVRLWFGTISAGGIGAVSVSGTGGTSTSAGHSGVELDTSPAAIFSASGNVSVTGRGGGRGQSHGVAVLAGTQIFAGGTGIVTIDGTGGPLIGNNYGVRVAGTITSSGGAVEVTGQGGGDAAAGATNDGVRVEAGGIITASGSAGVSVSGTGGTTTGGQNAGVQVIGTITSGGGNVVVNGQGGSNTGTGDSNHGVLVFGTLALISAGGNGSVAVNGVGGVASATSNHGVRVSLGRITSSGGDVAVSGLGGGKAQTSSAANYGVSVQTGGTISAGSLGTVGVDGQGGIGNGGSNWGIELQGTDSKITSGGGAVTVSGAGGSGTGGSNGGVIMSGSAIVTAGGTGSLEVNGLGGSSGNDNVGIWVVGNNSFSDINAKITSAGGAVNLVGQGGGSNVASSRNVGIKVSHGGKVLAGAGGTVTLTGAGGLGTAANDGISIENRFSLVSSGGGNVSIDGLGGGSGAGSGNNRGVNVLSGGTISSGTGGDVTVVGTGGVGSIGNSGVVVSLNDVASGTISSGGGNVSVTGVAGGSGTNQSSYGVYVFGGGEINAGGNGSITVDGTGGSGSGDENQGVRVESGTIGLFGGPVHVSGQGGDGTGHINAGVLVRNGRISGGTGMAIVIEGTGGANAASNSYGVWLEGASTQIGANGGAIQVVGQGGGSSTANFGIGVFVSLGARILTNSANPISVEGTGSGGGSTTTGVRVVDSGTHISSMGGHVTVTGKASDGSATSNFSHGITVGPAASITAGGNVTLVATGGGGSGVENYGFLADGHITSNNGNVSLTATGGPAAYAVKLQTFGNLRSLLNGGSVTVAGDSMDFRDSSQISAANGTATFKPKSTDGSVGVRLGGADAPGMLGLTQDEIRLRVGASNWVFGHSSAGPIEVLGNGPNNGQGDFWSHSNTKVILNSGANINLGGSIRTFGGSLLLSPGVGGHVLPTGDLVDAIISPDPIGALGSLEFANNATLRIDINGLDVNSEYRQLNVEGPINLTGANLLLTGSHTPSVGESFIIVNNDGIDPIIGRFSGLPEGAEVPNVLGSGLNAAITYVGGVGGNDVVLTVVVDADGVPQNVEDGAPNNGDGNNDGTPDSAQSNVTSLPSAVPGSPYVTLASSSETTLSSVEARTVPEDAPGDVDFPLGVLSFTIEDFVGDDIELEIFLPDGVTANTYYKFGPLLEDDVTTPDFDETDPHWYEFLYDPDLPESHPNYGTGAEFIGGNKIILHFMDGKRGDNDREANGQIVDPSGPGIKVEATPLEVASFVVNDGALQRSMVTSVKVTFNRPVTSVTAADFDLLIQSGLSGPYGASGVSLNPVLAPDGLSATITFSTGLPYGSLQDGRYKLAVKVEDLNHLTADFYRLFGDSNNDAEINAVDLDAFRTVLGKVSSGPNYPWYFDFNNDGRIDASDYNQVRSRNGKKV